MKYLAEHIVALEIAVIMAVILMSWGIGVHFENKMEMLHDEFVEQNARIVQTYDMTVANTRKDSTYYVESYLRQFEAEKEAVLRDIRKKDSILTSDSEYLKQRQKLWAKEHGYMVRRKPGSYDDTSNTVSIEFTETASDGKPKMSGWDQEVMNNHLQATPYEGKDPRGHKFLSFHKRNPHTLEILNFKYGSRYPWRVKDLTTGETLSYGTNGIMWDKEV